MNKKIAEFALDFEKKGTAAYLNFAAKARNPLSKKLFYTLARQEIDHAAKIDEFYQEISDEKTADTHSAATAEKELQDFFEHLKKTQVPEESSLEIYETAMELEKRGYAAYKKFHGESDDEAEKRFLEFLLNEEKKHIDSIANVYSYLSGTSDWLEREESKTWNWMNI